MSADQRVSLRRLEEQTKLRGWIVVLSADSEGGIRITDTSGAQFLISPTGQVTTVAT